MIRRVALGALAVPLLVRPGLAQNQTQNQAGQGVVSSQAPPATDLQQRMLGAMAFALTTAQLAERKAENGAVRLFGRLEAEEQTAFTTARETAGLRVPTIELMSEQQRRMMLELRDMEGSRFDRMFLQGQVAGHQALLELHEAAMRSPTSREEGMLATVAIPAIRTHQAMLDGIQRSMRG
jgi:putative membrane protein